MVFVRTAAVEDAPSIRPIPCPWCSFNTKMLLWVAKENGPARAFYERMGGSLLREKSVMMHGAPLLEAAYGYDLAQTGCSQSPPL